MAYTDEYIECKLLFLLSLQAYKTKTILMIFYVTNESQAKANWMWNTNKQNKVIYLLYEL